MREEPRFAMLYRKFKQTFFRSELYRQPGELSIVFLVDENPNVASDGSGGVVVGSERSVPDHTARSNSERAAPSACVGNRFSAPQAVFNVNV
jgi:hypothetical protein